MKNFMLLVCFLPFATSAQDFYFSLRGGLANYQGDLQAKPITFSQAKFLGSFGARYDLSEHFTARTYFSLTSLQADDKKGNATMKMRNLNFQTKLFSWELGAQYNILSLNNSWWTPYVFAGIGVFHFNPYTHTTGGVKTYLQPLSTEGEGFIPGENPYKLTQFSIPFGAGAEYAVNEDIRLGLEFGYNKLFTDHLDDVSKTYVDESALLGAKGQTAVDLAYRGYEVGAGPYPAAKTARGNDKQKDAWYSFAFTLTIRSFIDQYKRIAGLPAYQKDKKVGCPAANQHN